MTTTVTIGKRLVPLDHIALIEPFDAASHPGMKSDKAFRARVVLIDRQSVLTEETLEAFASAHTFRLVPEDQVAINPAIRFSVESFEPANGFEPNKPYLTRLQWRDLDGNTQSKLLLAKPETVLAVAVTGEAAADAKPAEGSLEGSGRKPTASSIRPRSERRRRRQPTEQPTPP